MAPPQPPTLDDLLREVSDLGSYQRRVCVMAAFLTVSTSIMTYLPLFVLSTPAHRCVVNTSSLETVHSDTYSTAHSEELRHLVEISIPRHPDTGMMDSCYIWATGGVDRPSIVSKNNDDIVDNATELQHAGDLGIFTINTSISGEDVPVSQNSSLPSRLRERCRDWVYDTTYFDPSLVEKLDLVCDRSSVRTHANMAMMLGMLAGALCVGAVQDVFGRKPCLLAQIVVLVATGIANVFIYDVTSLIVCRFMAGFASHSVYLATFVLGMEFVSPEWRRAFTLVMSVTWILGGLALCGVAVVLRGYWGLTLATALPALGFLSYFCFLDESPRWLLSKWRVNEAQVILERIASVNKVSFPNAMFSELASGHVRFCDTSGLKLICDGVGSDSPYISRRLGSQSPFISERIDSDSPHMSKRSGRLRHDSTLSALGSIRSGRSARFSEVNQQPASETLFRVFRYKSLTIRFAIIAFCWAVNSLVYYALLFNTSNLVGSIYLNFLLLNCVDMAANLLAYVVLERLGRKVSYCGFMMLATAPCLLSVLPCLLLPPGDARSVWINGLALLGRGGVSTAFNVVYLYSAELFPTTVRNSVMGAFSMAARIGSIMAPYTADLGVLLGGSMSEILPLLVCGLSGLAAFCLTLVLPETVGKDLPGTVDDAVSSDNKGKHSKSRGTPEITNETPM